MAVEKEKLAAFEALVRYDLGFALYQAVEALKLTLSQHTQATFRFREDPIDIEVPVRREEFEGWIAPELASIASCVDGLFEAVSLDLSVVDRVFLTGGSSFIPAVRRIFETRFGQDRLRGGEELTSVASGLALASRAMG